MKNSIRITRIICYSIVSIFFFMFLYLYLIHSEENIKMELEFEKIELEKSKMLIEARKELKLKAMEKGVDVSSPTYITDN